MNSPLLFSLLLILFTPIAQAVQLDCDSLDQDKETIVLLNFNRQDKIVTATQKAATERGENFITVPSDDNPGDVNTETLYSTLNALKRCHARISSLILAAHDGGGYFWGGNNQEGFSHDHLMTALRHFSSVTSGIRSTYFWGCNSNARGILRGIYQPSQGKQDPNESAKCDVSDTACKENMMHFDKFFRGAFPIRTVWGNDQSALSNNNSIATNHLYLLLKEEDKLTKVANMQSYQRQLNEIRCRATTFLDNTMCSIPAYAETASIKSQVSISGTNGNCFYHRVSDPKANLKARIDVSYLNRPPSIASCQQELKTFDASLLQPLLEAKFGCDGADCTANNPADMRDIPDDTAHGKVREIYEYFTGDSDCQLVKDPSIATQFPNITLLRDLLFYNQIRDAIVANHKTEITRLTNDLAAFHHQNPKIDSLSIADIQGKDRSLTRADLLQKLRKIRAELDANLDRTQNNPSVKLQEASNIFDGFYQLLTLEPNSEFVDPHCNKHGNPQESCLLNAMIPPGWAEGAKVRSPIFGFLNDF